MGVREVESLGVDKGMLASVMLASGAWGVNGNLVASAHCCTAIGPSIGWFSGDAEDARR